MSTNLNLLTYNVKMFETLIRDLKNKDRAKWICEEIEKNHSNLDIIIFQELFNEKCTKIFKKKLDKLGFKYNSQKLSSSDKFYLENGGVMIFSKHKIILEEKVIFNKNVKEDKYAAKGGLKIKIIKDDIPIYIIGTHLQSGRKEHIWPIKESQFNQLHKFTPENDITILAGDFNIDYHKYKDFLIKNMEKSNYKLLGIDREINTTVNDHFTDKFKKNYLDYIMWKSNEYTVTGELKVIDIRLKKGYKIPKKDVTWFQNKLNSVTDIFRKNKKHKIKVYNLSDHKPVFGFMKITKN